MSLMGTSSILDGWPNESFSLVYDLGKLFFGHPSRIDDVPIKLTQFCYIIYRERWATTQEEGACEVLPRQKGSQNFLRHTEGGEGVTKSVGA